MSKPRGPLALPGLALSLLGLMIAWERFHTYWEPQQAPLCSAAVVGHEILQGRALYSQVFDDHPPAFAATFALAQALGGYGPYSILLLDLAMAWALMGGLFWAGYRYGGTATGLLAAGLFALLSGDLPLWANQPSPEGLALVPLVLAMALLMGDGKKDRAGTAWAGLLLGLATFYLVSAWGLVLFWTLVSIWRSSGEAGSRHMTTGILVRLAGIPAALWALAALVLVLTGCGRDFWGEVFSYNLYRMAQVPGPWGRFWPCGLSFGVPFLLIGLCGILRGSGERPHPWALLAAGLSWAPLASACGSFSPTSYQAWLPFSILAGAWGSFELARGWKPAPTWVRALPGLLLAVFCLCREAPYYRLWAVDWSRAKAGGGAVESYNFARNLDDWLGPGEDFFLWGATPQLYYLTRRDPPGGVSSVEALLRGPSAGTWRSRVAGELDRLKPDLFLLDRSDLGEDPDTDPVFALLGRDYQPDRRLAPLGGEVLFFVRKGSALERRLKSRT